jgi:NAD(P)-dependent dehydrogenase (short-subunit alcohol dehydrogenase family)
MKVAIITGASRGLGRALARALATRNWALVLDARGQDALAAVDRDLAPLTTVVTLAGDVTDPSHRRELVRQAEMLGGVDALINNASHLGPSPQPRLIDYSLAELRRVYEVNTIAPLALVQDAFPALRDGARIVDITSDAAVEPYEGWGGYGSSKAALEQLTAVLAAEHPQLRIYRVDPGDMRTQMHQEAFPGEDISDRPLPDVAVPGLIELLEGDLPSGRYQAQTMTDVLEVSPV